MPEAILISYTGHGHPDPLYAARLLAFTKNTRLQMTPDGFASFFDRSPAEVEAEVAYMASTIPSSWEFADLIFAVNGISRATAQQMTRTRTASFAMQSQRVTDMSQVSWDVPPTAHRFSFDRSMKVAVANYTAQVQDGASLEDARDLLPIGVHCNLVAKYNLRNFVELVRARDSLRVQGPYVDVVRQMRAAVEAVWPWSAVFFEAKDAKAIRMIQEVALALREDNGAMSKGLAGTLAKAADLLK